MTRSRSAVVWRDPRFRLYWTGQTVSEVGDRVSELALPLAAVTVLNARAVQVGALVAAIWLPNLLALFVGTWLDRLRSKQRMLISANLVQAAAIAAVPLAYAVDRLSMPVLYVAAVVGGLGGVLYHTAYAPFFVQLVPREQYLEANSLLSTTRSASFIAGPPLAGALVSILTAPIALVVDACSFLLSSLLISRVDIDEPARDAAHQETYRRRLRLGVRYLRYHPFLRATLACSTTLNFFSLVVQAVLIIYAVRSLGLSAGSIGLALGVGASGGLVGAAIASRVAHLIGTGYTIAAGAVLFSLPFAFLPLAEGGPLAYRVAAIAAAEFVSALGIMLFDITMNSLQAAVTHDSMRSRVSGAYATVNYGIRPLGAILGGWTAERIGIPTTIVIASIAGSLAVAWLVRSPVLKTRRIADLEPHPADQF